MLGKFRKSSRRVTLVLIGLGALGGCGGGSGDTRKDVYRSRDDCLADWGNKPEDCKPATEPRHASSGFWYGPAYGYRYGGSGSGWTRAAPGARAIGSTSTGVSRGGFGASGHSSGG